jgi:hypothetical protein
MGHGFVSLPFFEVAEAVRIIGSPGRRGLIQKSPE